MPDEFELREFGLRLIHSAPRDKPRIYFKRSKSGLGFWSVTKMPRPYTPERRERWYYAHSLAIRLNHLRLVTRRG